MKERSTVESLRGLAGQLRSETELVGRTAAERSLVQHDRAYRIADELDRLAAALDVDAEQSPLSPQGRRG